MERMTINVPEQIYEPLAKAAKNIGRTPEELAVVWLETASRITVHDPVENFIGKLKTDISDWPDQHDKYIGQGLVEQNKPGI